MPEDFVNSVTDRYVELFEKITGDTFEKADNSNIEARIEANVLNALKENVKA
jgi:phosphoribosylaminoimidazole-succinocarboxamide synthase